MTRKKNQLIASLAYQKRRAKRRAQANETTQKTQKELKMNWKQFFLGLTTIVVIAAIAIFAILSFTAPTGCETTVNGEKITVRQGDMHPLVDDLLCRDGIFVENVNKNAVVAQAPADPTTEKAIAPTYPPETSPRQNDTSQMDISSWLGTNDEGLLPAGMAAIGDVSVNDRIYYDSGSGEATLVINNSSKSLKITANWGASIIDSTDEAALKAEIWKTGCDQNNGGCSRIRTVTCTDAGCTEVFEDRPTK